jgi:predicted DNA-binding ribbon-helix-helix protein
VAPEAAGLTEPDRSHQAAGGAGAGGEGKTMIRRPELSLQKTKRSLVIRGRKTSISLEAPFWVSFKEIAAREGFSVADLVNHIDTDREHANLSSTIRLYVLDHYRRLAEQALAAKGKR